MGKAKNKKKVNAIKSKNAKKPKYSVSISGVSAFEDSSISANLSAISSEQINEVKVNPDNVEAASNPIRIGSETVNYAVSAIFKIDEEEAKRNYQPGPIPKNPKIIPVLFTTNNYGIPQYEFCAASICANLEPGYMIKIYCIYENGSEDIYKIPRLKELFPDKISEVVLFNFEETCEQVNWSYKKKQWPDVIYYSLYAEMLIEDDNILFFDDDVLAFSSISRLWEEIDLGDDYAWAGSVQMNAGSCTGYLSPIIDAFYPGVKYSARNYINKGISKINLKLWRKEHAFEKLKAILTNLNFGFPEQDAMNVVFYGRVKNLDPQYAFFNSSFYTTVYLDKDKQETFRLLGREYCNRVKDCLLEPSRIVAVHYAGGGCKYWKPNLATALRADGIGYMRYFWHKLSAAGYENDCEAKWDESVRLAVEAERKKMEEEKLKKAEAEKRAKEEKAKSESNSDAGISVSTVDAKLTDTLTL